MKLLYFHILALLPDNFKPAPRETKADEEGIVNTLDRKLKNRVYLMIDGSFPTTDIKVASNDDDKHGADCESLLDAAVRGVDESTSRGKKKGKGPLNLYCASQAPIGVQLDVYDEDQQKSTGSYGTKTFFVKVQYDDGMLKGDNIAWLDRSEIVEKLQSDSKDDEAKFFRYLL